MRVSTWRTFLSLVCAHADARVSARLSATFQGHPGFEAHAPHRQPSEALLLAFAQRDPVADPAAAVVAVVLHRVQQVLRLEGEVGPAVRTELLHPTRHGGFELATHSKMKTSIAVLNIGIARSAKM